MTYEQYQADRLMPPPRVEMHGGILVEQDALTELTLDQLAEYIREHLPNRNKQTTTENTQ